MWQQPVLTANGVIGTDEFAVSSGGGADSDAYKAFDSNINGYVSKTNAGSWLMFYSKTSLEITAIELYESGYYLPRKGLLQVSYDNGASWLSVGSWEGDSTTIQITIDDGSVYGNYFRLYVQEKCTRSGNASISNITITAEEAGNTWVHREYSNINKTTYNNSLSLTYYLPFTNSTTEDICGNTWTQSKATPVIDNNRLVLHGSDCIFTHNLDMISIVNHDFTIHFWMTYKDSKTSEGGIFTHASKFAWQVYSSKLRFNADCTINGSSRWLEIDSVNLGDFKNTNHHFAIVRHENTLYFFFDGVLKTTYTVGTFTGSVGDLLIGKRNNNQTNMEMDHFLMHDSALWTENFTPPSQEEDYNSLSNAIINLPLTEYTNKDLCGRLWYPSGGIATCDVLKNCIFCDGAYYLNSSDKFKYKGQNFIIDCTFVSTVISTTEQELFELYYSNTYRIQIGLNANTNKPMLFKGNGNVTIFANNKNVSDGKMHHATLVCKNDIAYFYIDNDLIGSFTHGLGQYDYDIYVGARKVSSGIGLYYNGSIGSFRIYDNVYDPIDENNKIYEDIFTTIKKTSTSEITYTNDIVNKTTNPYIENKCKVYLPFTTSTTEDLSNRFWLSGGTPTIDTINGNAVLNLPGNSSYIYSYNLILGSKDFTICGWFNMSSSSGKYARIFTIFSEYNSHTNSIQLIRDNTNASIYIRTGSNSSSTVSISYNTDYFFALVYDYNLKTLSLYLNGVFQISLTNQDISRRVFPFIFIGRPQHSDQGYFVGNIRDFKIYDGYALKAINFVHTDSTNYFYTHPIASYIRFDPYLEYNGFYSSSYGVIPKSVLGGLTTFTIEVELSTTTTKTTHNHQGATIIGREISNNWMDDFTLYVSSGKLCFWSEPKSHSTSTTRYTSSTTINDGSRHKISLVSNGGKNTSIYVDGVCIANFAAPEIKITSDYDLYLGYSSNSDSWLQMNLYELRLWNKALTQEEIFADIESDAEGLVGWYKAGVNGFADLTGNGNNITSNNYRSINAVELLNTYNDDISCILTNETWTSFSNLKAYLNFDNSNIDDKKNNVWTAYNNPQIDFNNSIYTFPRFNVLNLNGTDQYVQSSIELGGRDFTIDFYFAYTDNVSNDGCAFIAYNDESHFISLQNTGYFLNYSKINSNIPSSNGTWVHACFVYNQKDQNVKYYRNGSLMNTTSTTIFNTKRTYQISLGKALWTNNSSTTKYFKGIIAEFRIYNGYKFYTANFSAPGKNDYINLNLDLLEESKFEYHYNDIQKIRHNKPLSWKYYNQGTAEDLCIPGKTCTWIEDGRTTTGISFYQFEREKCFDIPSCMQIYIKFDLYHIDGYTIFRVYNDAGNNMTTGIVLRNNTKTKITLFSNSTELLSTNDIVVPNTIQTWILFMFSNKYAGKIKLWCDGQEVANWQGNVNDGNPFTSIYIQTDPWLQGTNPNATSMNSKRNNYPFETNSDNLFSNVIISDDTIEFSESLCGDILSIVRNISNDSYTKENSLIIDMPFDTSYTEDLCGNTWSLTTAQTVTIEDNKLKLNNSYSYTTDYLELGGQDFTISLYFSVSSSTGNWPRIFTLMSQGDETDAGSISFRRYEKNNARWYLYLINTNMSYITLNTDTLYHFELDYDHSETIARIFINGQLQSSLTKEVSRTIFNTIRLGKSEYNADSLLTGNISHFQIYDGRVLHTENFTSPENGYSDLEDIVVNMPFDRYIDEDLCGRTWYPKRPYKIHFSENMQDNAISFNEAYIQSDTEVIFYGLPFTIYCEFSFNYKKIINNELFSFKSENSSFSAVIYKDGKLSFICNFPNTTVENSLSYINSNYAEYERKIESNIDVMDNKIHILEINYDGNGFYLFLDGIKSGYTQYNLVESDGYTCCIGGNYYLFSGDIKNFKVYRGINLHNTNNYNALDERILKELESNNSSIFIMYCDINISINNESFIPPKENMKFYLPGDSSTTEDLCGNSCYATNGSNIVEGVYGSTASRYYRANNSNALFYTSQTITLGSEDFTIRFWAKFKSYDSWVDNASLSIFSLKNTVTLMGLFLHCRIPSLPQNVIIFINGYRSFINLSYDEYHFVEFVYQYKKSCLDLYIDNKHIQRGYTNIASAANKIEISPNNSWFTGGEIIIDELEIYSGIHFHKNLPGDNKYYEKIKKPFILDNNHLTKFEYKRDIILKLNFAITDNIVLDYPSNFLCTNNTCTISDGISVIEENNITDITPFKVLELTTSNAYLSVEAELGDKDFIITFDIAWDNSVLNSSLGTRNFLTFNNNETTLFNLNLYRRTSTDIQIRVNTTAFFANSKGYLYDHYDLNTAYTVKLYYYHDTSKIQINTSSSSFSISIPRGTYTIKIGNLSNYQVVHYLYNIKIYDGTNTNILSRYTSSNEELIEHNMVTNGNSRFLFDNSINYSLYYPANIKKYPNIRQLKMYKEFSPDIDITKDSGYNDIFYDQANGIHISKYGLCLDKEFTVVDKILLGGFNYMLDFWLYLDNETTPNNRIVAIKSIKTNNAMWELWYKSGSFYINANKSKDLSSATFNEQKVDMSTHVNLEHKWINVKIIVLQTQIRVYLNDMSVSTYSVNTGLNDYYDRQECILEIDTLNNQTTVNGYINNIRLYETYIKGGYNEIPTKETYDGIDKEREDKSYKFSRRIDLQRALRDYDIIHLAIWHNDEIQRIQFNEVKNRPEETLPSSVMIYHDKTIYSSPIIYEDDAEFNNSKFKFYHNEEVVALKTK